LSDKAGHCRVINLVQQRIFLEKYRFKTSAFDNPKRPFQFSLP
jgi:hypothetical protein